MSKPLVGIVMGSDSDLDVMKEAGKVLEDFSISYELTIASAHRSPQRAISYAKNAQRRGLKAIIAGAGGAAHLAGVIAAHTTLPVIAVPLNSPLKGLDSFYSTLQMPSGVPVATMGIGRGGAKNAGILAAQILGITCPNIRNKLRRYKSSLARSVVQKARKLKSACK